jgi:hypothetical protein
MTNIWTPNGNRVAALVPGPDDLFVVTTIGGRRVTVQPIDEYDKALKTAEAFARQTSTPRPLSVKVLCLSLRELLAQVGTTPAEFFAGMTPEEDAELRRLAIDACMNALRKSNEASVRADAMEALTALGVIAHEQ